MPMAIDLSLGFGAFTPSTNNNQTWDSAKKGTSFVLSDGNRVATSGTAGWNIVLGQTGKSTGKWCVGFKVETYDGSNPNFFMYGVGTTTGDYDVSPAYASCGMLQPVSGEAITRTDGFTVQLVYPNIATTLNMWVAFYVDLDAGKVWAQASVESFVGGQDPATGTNPWATFTPGLTLYPACAISGGSYAVRLLSGTDFPTTVPSGFSAW